MGGVTDLHVSCRYFSSPFTEASSPHYEVYSTLHGKNPADNYVRGTWKNAIPPKLLKPSASSLVVIYTTRKQQKNMSATGGAAPTVEVEVGQAWQQGVDSSNIPTRAPKEEEVAAGLVSGGGVDDGVIMVEEF